MTWTRLSDTFNDDPLLMEVSRSARLLHVEGLVYCNKHLQDGRLPFGALPRITDSDDPHLDAKLLEEAGVWERHETYWQLDWSDQEDAAVVKARRESAAEKQRRYRNRRDAHARGDHGLCQAPYCKSVTGHVTGDVTGLVTPSRPVPSRPEGTGTGQGAETAAAGAEPHGSASRRGLPPAHPFTGECCELPDVHPVHTAPFGPADREAS